MLHILEVWPETITCRPHCSFKGLTRYALISTHTSPRGLARRNQMFNTTFYMYVYVLVYSDLVYSDSPNYMYVCVLVYSDLLYSDNSSNPDNPPNCFVLDIYIYRERERGRETVASCISIAYAVCKQLKCLVLSLAAMAHLQEDRLQTIYI